jgi:hypothetical protein
MSRVVAGVLISLMLQTSAFAQGPLQQSAERATLQQTESGIPAPTAKRAFLWSGMALTAAGIGLYADTFLKEECIDRTGGLGTTTPCTKTTKNSAVRALGLATLIGGAGMLTVGVFRELHVGPSSISYRMRF